MARKNTAAAKAKTSAPVEGAMQSDDELNEYEVLDVILYSGDRYVEGDVIYLDDAEAALLLKLKKPAIRATNKTRESEAVGSGTGTDATLNGGNA